MSEVNFVYKENIDLIKLYYFVDYWNNFIGWKKLVKVSFYFYVGIKVLKGLINMNLLLVYVIYYVVYIW